MPLGFMNPSNPLVFASNAIPDPYQGNCIVALHMENDVYNNGVNIADTAGYNMPFYRGFDVAVVGDHRKFGKSCAWFNGWNGHYHSPRNWRFYMTGDYTVELWMRYQLNTDSTYSAYVVSHRETHGWQEPDFAILRDHRPVYIYDNATRITGNPIPQNEWVHVSYGCRNNTHYMYINGILQGTYWSTNKWQGWSCTLGTSGWQRNNNTIDKFRGHIDEFRWWNVSIRDGATNFKPPSAPWKDGNKFSWYEIPTWYNFKVPKFKSRFNIVMHGAGGQAGNWYSNNGTWGTASTIDQLGMWAGGGGGGQAGRNSNNGGAGGEGGGAGGGDVNIAGTWGNRGQYAGNGQGGTSNGSDTWGKGGWGALDGSRQGGGGGGGGFCSKSFTPAQLQAGRILTCTVGLATGAFQVRQEATSGAISMTWD